MWLWCVYATEMYVSVFDGRFCVFWVLVYASMNLWVMMPTPNSLFPRPPPRPCRRTPTAWTMLLLLRTWPHTHHSLSVSVLSLQHKANYAVCLSVQHKADYAVQHKANYAVCLSAPSGCLTVRCPNHLNRLDSSPTKSADIRHLV